MRFDWTEGVRAEKQFDDYADIQPAVMLRWVHQVSSNAAYYSL